MEKNQDSVYAFINNTESVTRLEMEYIQRGTDLAAIAHDQEYGWFNGFLEKWLLKFSRKATTVSCTSFLLLPRKCSKLLI